MEHHREIHVDHAKGRDFPAVTIVECTNIGPSHIARISAAAHFGVPHHLIAIAPPPPHVRLEYAEHGVPWKPHMLTTGLLTSNPRADLGKPYIARNPKPDTLVAAEKAMGRISPHRSRIRKGKLVRFRRKSHKRTIDPGPSPKPILKQHAKMMKQLAKKARPPEEMEKARKEHGARSVDIRNQLAHRSSKARRAKLASRRR